MTIFATTRNELPAQNLRKMPIWRDFCVPAFPNFFLENWSKKHHIGILIGSGISGGRYE
ncbi:hypothetical protein [Dyella solisilvae]|uniref:hypothetical protein n=1 Tax=Dyella solisilvae TaxID=1920168 RepID=UPI001313EF03|nr:hypothetical protein [Dyella solisilvae]